jgi:putative ABC transport system permease protein
VTALDRKLWRDLLHARGLLAAIVVIIAVGAMCYVMLSSAYQNLTQSKADYYRRCAMADFRISMKKAPTAEAESLAQVPGVSRLTPRITFDVTVDLADEPKPLAGRVISMPDSHEPVINDVIMVSGGYFTDQHEAEVIVIDSFARARGLEPGDTVRLILNNRKKELLIVGTAISSEFVYIFQPGGLAPEKETYGVFYIKETFAEDVFDFDGACNELLGRLDPSVRDQPRAVLDRIEDRLDPFGVSAATPRELDTSHRAITDEINGLRVMSSMMPVIFLSIAALVLNILMSRLAEQQRVVVGTLKAIGYSRREVTVHFLKFGACVGLIGGVVGALGGYLAAGGLTRLYRTLYEFPRLVNEPFFSTLAIGVGISVAFALLGSLRGLRAIGRLGPAEAMRPAAPEVGGAIALERIPALWRRLSFRDQMTVRRVWRHRMRTAVGIFAAAMGAGLLLSSFYSIDAMLLLLDFQFNKVLRSDYDVTFEGHRDFGALHEAERWPGVDRAEPVFMLPCRLVRGHHEKRIGITGLIEGARLTVPHDGDGRPVRPPEQGLLLTRKLAEILHVQPGDEVELIPTRGVKTRRRVPVTNIVEAYLGMSAYADYDYLCSLMGEEPIVSMVQLSLSSSPEDRAAFYRTVKELPGVQTVSANDDRRENLEELLLGTLKYSIGTLIAFSGLIYGASVLTASLIALSERRRETATLRAMGYTSREVGSVFLRESLIVNIAGAIVGLPLGLALVYAMVEGYDTEFYRLPLILTWHSIAITMVLAIVFTVGSHVIVQRMISRMAWLEALNVKE